MCNGVQKAAIAARLGIRGFAAVIMLLIATLQAAAESHFTRGVFPDPIDAPTLERYADELGLSHEQRTAVEGFIDQYFAEYRALREGEIARFERNLAGQSSGALLEADEADAVARRARQILRSMDRIDERFFDRLNRVLTEEQSDRLRHVQRQRQRVRDIDAPHVLERIEIVDLTMILRTMPLDAQTRHDIARLVESYDVELTLLVRQLRDANMRGLARFHEILGESTGGESLDEPYGHDRLDHAARLAGEPIRALRSRIDRLNHRTCAALMATLPDESARQLRDAFYWHWHPDFRILLTARSLSLIDALLEESSIDEPARAALKTLREESQGRLDQLLDRLARTHLDAGSKGNDPLRKDLFDTRREFDEWLMMRLRSVVDESHLERIEHTIAASTDADVLHRAETAPSHHAGRLPADVPVMRKGDGFLPQPMRWREVLTPGRDLGFDDGQRAIAFDLHVEYLRQWRAMLDELLPQVEEAKRLMAAPHPSADPVAEANRRAMHLQNARHRLLTRATEIESVFFRDLEVAVIDAASAGRFAMLRRARERAVYRTAQPASATTGESRLHFVDLAEILSRFPLAADARQAIATILADYESQASDLWQKRYERALEADRTAAVTGHWHLHLRAADAEDTAAQKAHHDRVRQMRRKRDLAMREVDGELARLNLHYLEQLCLALPAEAAIMLQHTFEQEAFPKTLRDPLSMEAALSRAMDLADVSDHQQQVLREVAAEYAPEYCRVRRAMMDLHIEMLGRGSSLATNRAADRRAILEKRRRMTALEHERQNLNVQAIRQLRSTLTPQQLRRIEPLPELREITLVSPHWSEPGT